MQGPSKCPQWALSQQTRPLFPSWMFHQLLVPGQTTSIGSYSIIRLGTPRVRLYRWSYVTIHSVIIVIFTCKTSNDVTEESLPPLFSFYRTLGRYHHQTISASWSRPTKGESPRARLTSGTCAITAARMTISLVVTVCFLVFADTFECMFSRHKLYNASEALITFRW